MYRNFTIGSCIRTLRMLLIEVMWSKLSRLSYGQLVLLLWFVQHPNKTGSVSELAKHTKIKGKALGGVLSSLSRTKYRGLPLIEPWGRAVDDTGLRWKLNKQLGSVVDAKKEIARLVATY